MKLRDVLIEATNLGRTDSFPVFLNGEVVGRIYLVESDDIDWLSQGELDDAETYVVFIKGIEPEKLTDKNLKYYQFDDDWGSDEHKKLAGMFGRAFGFFEKITSSRNK